MSVFIKICGLRDAESIAAAIESGANALGFVFAASPRQIAPVRAAQLAAHLPDHVRTVAVTRHPNSDELRSIFRDFMPNYLQTDAEDFAEIDLPQECEPLPVFREGTHANPTPGARILFEGADSGTGQRADWDEACRLASGRELILAGGLNVENIAAAIEHVRPWGVDVSSGVESERGIKDPQLIREFIFRAREKENSVEQ